MSTNTNQELDAPKYEPESPNQFHQFCNLPAELRWKIWEMAICHDRTPKIHYYSLFNTDSEGCRHSQLQQMMRDNPPPAPAPIRYWPNGRRVPVDPTILQSRPNQFSWVMANRFQYFWNASLLVACRESRQILLRTFVKFVPCYTKEQLQDFKLRYDRYLVATRDREQKFNLCVKNTDIVCLRFAPEDMAACVSLSWEILLTRLPMFHLPLMPDMNLALEYDESWNEGISTKESILELMSEPSTRGLALRAYWAWLHTKLPSSARMWLIDQDAKPLPKNYKLGRQDEHCNRHCQKRYVYKKALWEPQWNQVFIDGKSRYVECYMHNGLYVPVLYFIDRMKLIATPTNDEFRYTLFTPCYGEDFFNVLRQLPGSDGTG